MAASVTDTSRTTSHIRLLTCFSLLTRVLYLVLLVSSSYFKLFDSSPRTITQTPWVSFLLRWDVFHFAHIAENGYVYEYEWAFFPGTPFLMRFTAEIIRFVKQSPDVTTDDLLLGGLLAVLTCDTTRTLYQLSLHHIGSPSLAFITSLLSLIPSSPVTLLLAPYAEPFFTYLSYKGMLCCARSQWFAASVLFALAGTFRSNGILLSGFILWGRMVQPILHHKKFSLAALCYSVFLVAITFVPFIYHHYSAYRLFCGGPQIAPWCLNFPPSIYAYVQSTYWNVGPFRYWTPQQVPNFIISAPPLISIFYFTFHYITRSLIPQLLHSASPSPTKSDDAAPASPSKPSALPTSPFLSLSLTPHVLHALFLTTTLLFASHTQIILRVGPSMPLTYWAAAWLVVERPYWGRWWVGWSVIWSVVSVVLWSNFLPPA